MTDIFNGVAPGTNVPPSRAFAITANGQPLAQTTRAIFVGTTGHLTATLAGDINPVTFKNIPSGTWLNLRVKSVDAATTASDLVGLY